MPFGMQGELVLEGPTVAMGYTDKNLTKKVFVHNEESIVKNRYFTGDSCYISKSKLIHFIGRKDRQVKLRGYRVELNEIEQAIMKISDISEFQLLLNEEATVLSLAYIGTVSEEQAKKALEKKLPSYMVPSIIRKMDSFPLLTNGKVDPKSLAKSLEENQLMVKEEEELDSHLGNTIKHIWQDVLRIPRVFNEDNFFDLGGNSLLAIQVIRKINEKIDGTITIQKLFESKNLGSFIDYIEEEEKNEGCNI
jgi:long-subunit acyl-CoA synthetase (AMP-forming)